MNVLVVANQLDRCEFNLLCGLERLGVGITAIVDAYQPYGDALRNSTVNIIYYTIKGRANPFAVKFLRPFFKSRRFDIVHCFSSRALGNTLLASTGIGIKRIAYRGTSGHISRLDPSAWLTYLHPGLHKIICVSHAVERYLSGKKISPDKLMTIYKGHDVAWYQDQCSLSLDAFGIPAHSFTVGCVANMRPVKGVDYLIEAMRLVPQELPIHLLLIGEVRDERISALLRDSVLSRRVHCAGFQKEAAALVGKADCFVMPSIKREGLPKALLEAMSKKIAPIVTEVGGMPEVVRGGIDGLVVPPMDAQALADAIVRLYSNPDEKKSYAEAAHRRILNDFNIQQTVEKTFSLYNELLRN